MPVVMVTLLTDRVKGVVIQCSLCGNDEGTLLPPSVRTNQSHGPSIWPDFMVSPGIVSGFYAICAVKFYFLSHDKNKSIIWFKFWHVISLILVCSYCKIPPALSFFTLSQTCMSCKHQHHTYSMIFNTDLHFPFLNWSWRVLLLCFLISCFLIGRPCTATEHKAKKCLKSCHSC